MDVNNELRVLNNYQFIQNNRASNNVLLCVRNGQLSTVKNSDVTCFNLFLRYFNCGALAQTHISIKSISERLVNLLNHPKKLDELDDNAKKNLEKIADRASNKGYNALTLLRRNSEIEKAIEKQDPRQDTIITQPLPTTQIPAPTGNNLEPNPVSPPQLPIDKKFSHPYKFFPKSQSKKQSETRDSLLEKASVYLSPAEIDYYMREFISENENNPNKKQAVQIAKENLESCNFYALPKIDYEKMEKEMEMFIEITGSSAHEIIPNLFLGGLAPSYIYEGNHDTFSVKPTELKDNEPVHFDLIVSATARVPSKNAKIVFPTPSYIRAF